MGTAMCHLRPFDSKDNNNGAEIHLFRRSQPMEKQPKEKQPKLALYSGSSPHSLVEGIGKARLLDKDSRQQTILQHLTAHLRIGRPE